MRFYAWSNNTSWWCYYECTRITRLSRGKWMLGWADGTGQMINTEYDLVWIEPIPAIEVY